MKIVFIIAACTSIIAVATICVFMFANGFPAMAEIGVIDFLFGMEWRPGSDKYGIFPMIVGSIYATAGAIVIGVPIGVLTAVFLSKFCPKNVYKVLKPAIDLLAGIPSIVYGFFGLIVMVPFVRETFGGNGTSLLTASLILGMMILPTIIGVAESSINAVPDSYYEGALALGASKERSMFFVVLPAAKSGILAAVILGVGRAIGETMAVIWVAGNSPIIPDSLISKMRTMTTNIVLELSYAQGLHERALIATAVVLFIFILIINVSFSLIKGRSEK